MIYLYCLLPAELRVELDGVVPMEDAHPVKVVTAGRLQAAVSEVGEDFGEANLNARIRDLDWLSPRAVRHHDVVDGLYTRCHWLLPLTFGAIFRSRESLCQKLEASHDQLRAQLDRLRGREEWDFRLSRDEAQFGDELAKHSQALQQLQSELVSKSPGTRFLLERKLRNLQAQEAKRLAGQVKADVQRSLGSAAMEAHQDELAAIGASQKVRLELRSAYLIEEGQDAGLKEAVAILAVKYSPLGYDFELTGPWPAFNFAGGISETLR